MNDPADRELTISCGVALFNLRVASRHAGYGTEVQLVPDREERDLVARIALREGPEATAQEEALFEAIEARRTYRKPQPGLPKSGLIGREGSNLKGVADPRETMPLCRAFGEWPREELNLRTRIRKTDRRQADPQRKRRA